MGHTSVDDKTEEAIELLQQLGVKEYESRCFVGLSRLSSATAKDLSEVADVPRTRVYDATRVLEARGLVEVQHSSPQQFRAIPLDEAVDTLRDRYEERVDQLRGALDDVDPLELDEDDTPQEVWSMNDTRAIEKRTNNLVREAADEVVLFIGDESLLTDDLAAALNGADPGVDLLVGTLTDDLRDSVLDAVPDATTFTSGLEWLQGTAEEKAIIGRLLLVDRSTLLASTLSPGSEDERAVYGGGFRNGLVVVARRLMAQGLVERRDPAE